MASCERQISTENGVVTCDQKLAHTGMHHAKDDGGDLPAIDHSKTKDGDPIVRRDVPALEIWWPQEGDNSPVRLKKG